jgi:serralysin
VARGGADERTVVSFVNFLPSLAEGVRVDPASINGIANEPFLEGDGATSFRLQFEAAVSSFSNTLGYYKVKADGTISDTHVLFSNSKDVPAGMTVNLGTPADGESIGFFLIQNGFNAYGNLPDDLSFVASGGTGPADLDDGVPPILNSASRGALTIAPILHSIAAFNPGSATQVLSGVAPGGHDLRIGFEDMRNGSGDNDFQDLVISVHTNADNRFMP